MTEEADDEQGGTEAGGPQSFNSALRAEAANPTSRREEMRQMLFPPLAEAETPTKPTGDADGGKGGPEEIEVERPLSSPIETLRVFPLDNNPNNTTRRTK